VNTALLVPLSLDQNLHNGQPGTNTLTKE